MRSQSWRPGFVWWLSVLIAFLSVWIVVPAPVYPLLPISVGAPELSVWLAAAGIAVFAFAVVTRSRSAAIIAALSLLPPTWVLLRIPGTIRTFDAAMAATLGPAYLDGISPDVRSRLRQSPIAAADLFRGLPHPDSYVTRAVAFLESEEENGQALRVDIYRPSGVSRRPAVVQMYGGGWRSGTRENNAPMSSALAAQGFVVFAIDYRHSPRWQWPAQLHDVRAAVAWVKQHAAEYGADAGRLALLGRSSGAQLALIGGITSRDPAIRAIVALYSPVNLTSGYENPGFPDTLGLRELEVAFIGGTPAEKPEAYRDASPITHADSSHPPVLLISGGKDRIVYAAYSRTLYEHLNRSGTAVFLVIPWANHAFDEIPFGPSAQLELYYAGRFLAWALR